MGSSPIFICSVAKKSERKHELRLKQKLTRQQKSTVELGALKNRGLQLRGANLNPCRFLRGDQLF